MDLIGGGSADVERIMDEARRELQMGGAEQLGDASED
jgi:hypothetical protein